MKRVFNSTTLLGFIFATFLISILYFIIKIIWAPAPVSTSEIAYGAKGDYALMLVQCVLGTLAMLIPVFLRRKVGLNIPSAILIIYAVFLFCSIYLGAVRKFYQNVSHWDTILHLTSGVALGALGFSLLSLLGKSETASIPLSPIFASLFSFCFALSLGAIWEIYEFAIDYFLDTNSQRYALASAELLMGQAALVDTMKDLIVGAIGALAMSAVGYVCLKWNNGWLERFQVRLSK